MTTGIRLRPYQADVARAVLDSVFNRRGLTFTVEMARQAGKNELSAYLQMVLLLRNAARGGALVKAAPTFQPQALISIERVMQRLEESGLSTISRLDRGHVLRVGHCRATYLSAHPTSNVVGQTADLLLEIDEAQDVLPDKFNRDFRPMAAAQNATTVLYGTAWRSDSLLEQVKATERVGSSQSAYGRAGRRRHFRYDWQEVARHNRLYGAFVEGERQRLGEEHPLFRTQYALLPVDENTRLFSRAHVVQLHGDHPRQQSPRPGAIYAAGLDLAGAPLAITETEWGADRVVQRDETVLTIAEIIPGHGFDEPQVHIVQHYYWRGTPHGALLEQLTDLLKNVWRVRRVAVDATGIGEPMVASLQHRVGQAVQPITFTQHSKSKIGFGLLAMVNAGRLRLYADDLSSESAAARRQIHYAQAQHNANHTMNFYVPERDGRDDYLISLALAAHASAQEGGLRTAVGRSRSTS